METHGPKYPKTQLNGHPAGKKQVYRCIWAILRGGNQVGDCKGAKCPQNCTSVRLARDTANFWFWTARCKSDPNGTKLGQQTPFTGEEETIHDKKAAHTLPEWILSMNRDTGPLWRLTQSH